MLGIQFAESKWTPHGGTEGAYLDAVGDLGLMDHEFGPSVGGPQVRCLRDPSSGNYADTFRDAEKLHDDPVFQAQAAWEISKHGTDFTPWTMFKNKLYLNYKGWDYELRRGHPEAANWNK